MNAAHIIKAFGTQAALPCGSITSAAYTDAAYKNESSAWTTHTFTNVDIGAADADRYVVVMLCAPDVYGVPGNPTCTINGTAATLLDQGKADGYGSVSAFYAKVETGTTASIGIDMDKSVLTAGIAVYRLVVPSANGLTLYDSALAITNATTISSNINTQSSGVLIIGSTGPNTYSYYSMKLNGSTYTIAHNFDMRTNEYYAGGIITSLFNGSALSVEISSFTSRKVFIAVCLTPNCP